MKRKSLGNKGESLAQEYLESNGYRVIYKNWRSGRHGEVDLIAYVPQQHRIVFIEVKTRTNLNYGSPIESITETKQRRMRRLAEHFLAAYPDLYPNADVAFDLVLIMPGASHHHLPAIEHIISAF